MHKIALILLVACLFIGCSHSITSVVPEPVPNTLNATYFSGLQARYACTPTDSTLIFVKTLGITATLTDVKIAGWVFFADSTSYPLASQPIVAPQYVARWGVYKPVSVIMDSTIFTITGKDSLGPWTQTVKRP
jgi:hypothetical protein